MQNSLLAAKVADDHPNPHVQYCDTLRLLRLLQSGGAVAHRDDLAARKTLCCPSEYFHKLPRLQHAEWADQIKSTVGANGGL